MNDNLIYLYNECKNLCLFTVRENQRRLKPIQRPLEV